VHCVDGAEYPVRDRTLNEHLRTGDVLPPLTHLLIACSDWFVHWGWLAAVPIIPILPVFFILALLYYIGYFPRGLPLIWRLFRRYDGVLVMRGLALAIRRDVPMPQALFLVGDQYPLSIIGFRLRDAAQEVALGQREAHAAIAVSSPLPMRRARISSFPAGVSKYHCPEGFLARGIGNGKLSAPV
jgi:type II secretory pathway component PulF